MVAPGAVCPLGTSRTAGAHPRLVLPGGPQGSRDSTPAGIQGSALDEDDRPQRHRGALEGGQLPHLAATAPHLSGRTALPRRRRGRPAAPRSQVRPAGGGDGRLHALLRHLRQCARPLCAERVHTRPGDPARRRDREPALRTVLLALRHAHRTAVARAGRQGAVDRVGPTHRPALAARRKRQPLPGGRVGTADLLRHTLHQRPHGRAGQRGHTAHDTAGRQLHHAQHAGMDMGQLELEQDLGMGLPHDGHERRTNGRA